MPLSGKIGLSLFAALFVFLAARAVQMAMRDFVKQLEEKRACEERRCGYYWAYLKKGPPDLSHSQYHEAVNSFNYWKTTLERCEDDDISAPFFSNKMFELYRTQARM